MTARLHAIEKRSRSWAVQDPIHHLGACRNHRAQLMSVDQLCCRGTVVSGQARDLFDGHTVR
jgi:hypothetical protein